MPSEPGSPILLVTVQPPGFAPRTFTLEQLTERTRAYRTRRRMGRLANTLRKATEARDLLEHAVERDVANYVARVDEVHKRRDAVFIAKHGELDAVVTDLAEFEADLEEFGKNDPSGAYRGTGGEHG